MRKLGTVETFKHEFAYVYERLKKNGNTYFEKVTLKSWCLRFSTFLPPQAPISLKYPPPPLHPTPLKSTPISHRALPNAFY